MDGYPTSSGVPNISRAAVKTGKVKKWLQESHAFAERLIADGRYDRDEFHYITGSGLTTGGNFTTRNKVAFKKALGGTLKDYFNEGRLDELNKAIAIASPQEAKKCLAKKNK